MSIAKTVEKLTSYFLSLVCAFSAFFGIFGGEAQAAATEYEAHVAIFSDNLELAEQYVQLLHTYEYDSQRDILGEPGSGKSTDKTVITDGYGSRKYNVYFHVIDANRVLRPDSELNDLIKCCTGAVILYDVMDSKLDPMLKSPTFHSENIGSFLPIDTPLNNCIKYLQSFGRYGWWNALNFIMYNSENLTPEEQKERRSQLNFYTLELEDFYTGRDNKWNRGHPVWNSRGGIKNVLGWIGGNIYRSVFDEKFLTGIPGKVLKKNWGSWFLQWIPRPIRNCFCPEPQTITATVPMKRATENQTDVIPSVPYRYVGY